MKKNITGSTLQELQEILASWKEPVFHAKQIFAWIYKKQARDFAAMSDLPKPLREKLAHEFSIVDIALAEAQQSADGTRKFLFMLADRMYIEAATIPTEKRLTACISSQAGCKFACRFCASGMAGFKRNLSSAEILGQLLYIKREVADKELSHIVFMGTGEPLDNYDNVLRSIRAINADYGFGIGARRITVSTCGLIPGIDLLSREGLQIELSVSLHAADDATRNALMPVNKIYPLKTLMQALRAYNKKTNRQVTFEYILIKGVNADLHSARNVCTIMKGLDAKINLIPVNPQERLKLEPPNKLEILMFQDHVVKCGIPVTLRKARGRDIDAACGQLRLRYEKK